jgi:hypothetical protein
MSSLRSGVAPTKSEVAAALPGDDIVSAADIVMNRGFTLSAPPESVWPWLAQLGKRRAGWYLPRSAERLVPPGRRAIRRIDPAMQDLAVGDVIPDWGGRNETLEVVSIQAPQTLVFRSQRGRMAMSWAIHLEPMEAGRTRVVLRLRLGPVRRKWLARSGGELIDLLTIAGLAAGLRERVTASDR